MLDYPNFVDVISRGFNVVPLVKRLLADTQTPIRIGRLLRCKRVPFFLLESVEGGEKWGRYSLIGLDIYQRFKIEGEKAYLENQTGEKIELVGNPIDAFQSYLKKFRIFSIPGTPNFCGGGIGYFSFEVVRFFERCGQVKPNHSPFPDAEFLFPEGLIIFDNRQHVVLLIAPVVYDRYKDPQEAYNWGLKEIGRLESILQESEGMDGAKEYLRTSLSGNPKQDIKMISNMKPEDYREMVRRCRQYIVDGDVIQVVIAQHFSTTIHVDPFHVYRALRLVNPSPYMYYLDFGDGRVIAGSSPEVMVRVVQNRAIIRPIAGTRPRSLDPEIDRQRAEDLLKDPKERAEHVMLVDLARNDLGRIARIGSVYVSEYMVIERYSHVMHLVSQVEAELKEGTDALDVFKASFPAGTLSGAPKVRAMEIINELEPTRRGPYGGALGYISYGGQTMDLAITIRTVIMDHTRAVVTSGAGVVYDSDPQREYEETCHKMEGVRKALELAVNGFQLEELG